MAIVSTPFTATILRYNGLGTMKATNSKKTTFTSKDIAHIAKLARIPLSHDEEQTLAEGFTSTMKVVDELFAVNVKNVEPTHQVTDLENVLREDEVDASRTFTQETALANAKATHNGFFVVNQIREEK